MDSLTVKGEALNEHSNELVMGSSNIRLAWDVLRTFF